MNDLLGGEPSSSSSRRASKYEDVDTGPAEEEDLEANPLTNKFFNDINDIENDMKQIKHKLRRLQDAHEESKLLTKAKDMKVLKKRMERDISEVLQVAKGIKVKIEELDRENMRNRRQPGCEEGTGTDRQRMSVTANQRKLLKDLMKKFQDLRAKIESEYRAVVERRYYTVTGQKPDEELVDQLIETGDSEAIFQKAIQDQGRGQVLDTINEINERHDAVQEIQRQLEELHQIFMDMAVMVESQGELLDNVETNVDNAKDHVVRGRQELETARKTQLNTRKWMLIGIVGVTIIIIVIIIAVIISLHPWK